MHQHAPHPAGKMILYYTKRSPYARKVLVVAHEKKLMDKIEPVAVDLANKPDALLHANPLGKIPALQIDSCCSLADSKLICEFLDSIGRDPKLYPKKDDRFTQMHVMMLGEGISDSAVALFKEQDRPKEQQSEKAIAKHSDDINRTLDALEGSVGLFRDRVNIVSITIACALGYLDFRFSERFPWQQDHPALALWYKTFCQRESMKATMPVAA